MLLTISIKDKQSCIDLMMRQNHSISQMSALSGFLKVRFNSSEVLLLYRNIPTIVQVHCFTAPCTRVFSCLVGSLVYTTQGL